jgi:predicted transcriptional regulator
LAASTTYLQPVAIEFSNLMLIPSIDANVKRYYLIHSFWLLVVTSTKSLFKISIILIENEMSQIQIENWIESNNNLGLNLR